MENMPDPFLWHGIPSAFRAAGFEEVLRRSKSRPIMRYKVKVPPAATTHRSLSPRKAVIPNAPKSGKQRRRRG
jgi:hypothetical protein